MKFVGLAITVHALFVSFTLSGADVRYGMIVSDLFLVVGLVYCAVEVALKKKA
jgi:hypothetical protein